MHFRLLACTVLAVNLLSNVQPLAVRPAAQELRQCYVEGQPCGTPQQLYERIQHCLQDPHLCRDVKIVKAGDDPGNAAAQPVPGPLLPDHVATSLPAKRVIHSRIVSPPQPASASTGTAAAADSPATEQQGGSADAVTKAARELPLDPAVKALNDTLPYNAGAVERRLGLRRTRATGIDMRRRVPTPAEIVDALEPVKDSRQ
jgi:hypothetical protein